MGNFGLKLHYGYFQVEDAFYEFGHEYVILLSLHFPVVDGDDMTRYDDMKITGGTISNFDSVGNSMEEDKEDEEAMNDLEMELASQTGRLTGQLRKINKNI